jgi:predicted dithiol-disulfide oxidoreductase (DUF899 family)
VDFPHGGIVPEDYVFQGQVRTGLLREVRLSELFMPGKDVLVIHSMMFPLDPGDTRRAPEVGETDRLPLAEGPCPSCTALLDQLVFRRDGHSIRHFWGSELLYAPTESGQDSRPVGTIEPLWNLLDLTPKGAAPTGTSSRATPEPLPHPNDAAGPPRLKRVEGHGEV